MTKQFDANVAAYEEKMKAVIRNNRKEFNGVDQGMLRLSLLQDAVMTMMAVAGSLTEVKEIHSAYIIIATDWAI
jgi:hypothetical protein